MTQGGRKDGRGDDETIDRESVSALPKDISDNIINLYLRLVLFAKLIRVIER